MRSKRKIKDEKYSKPKTILGKLCKGVRNPKSLYCNFCFGGKKRGDIWHAQEIVRLNIMMAIVPYLYLYRTPGLVLPPAFSFAFVSLGGSRRRKGTVLVGW
jgi:hypothetical protein